MPRIEKLDPDLELEIRQEVQALAERFTTRADLTRETATLLFLRYDIYPSAGVVHNYTRRGSLTDINADLKNFWGTFKDRLSTNIPGTELPKALLEKTGNILNELWGMAVQEADQSLEKLREEARATVAEHRQAKEAAEAQSEKVALSAAEQVRQAIYERTEAQRILADVETQLAVERESKESAMRAIVSAETQAAQERATRELSETRFNDQLEALRGELARQTEQLTGDLNFAKRQIEDAREVGRNLKLQNEALISDKDIQEKVSRGKINDLTENLNHTNIKLMEAETKLTLLDPQIRVLSVQLSDATMRAENNFHLLELSQSDLRKANEIIAALSIQNHGKTVTKKNATAIDIESIKQTLRQQVVSQPSVFEVADMFSSQLEVAPDPDDPSEVCLWLATEDADAQVEVTPKFKTMDELESFCCKNLERYEAVVSDKFPPLSWFWQHL